MMRCVMGHSHYLCKDGSFTKDYAMNISLINHYSGIKDSRIAKKCDHKLIDIIVITVCATI